MKTPEDEKASILRRKAEARVAAMDRPAGSGHDAETTRHDLLVHQVELEMQNEELRRLHLALEAERARYFDLFDLAPVGYLTLDADNLILEANLTAARQLGLVRGQLTRLPFSRLIHPQDQDSFYLLRRKLLAEAAPQSCELRLLRADGSTLHARLEAATAPGPETPAPCRLTITDIGDIAAARDALAHREQEYRLLAENASDVVFRCSQAGLIEWITPSVTARVGWTPEQLVGRQFRDLVHPDDTDRLAAAQAGLKDGIGFEIELRIRIRTDGYHWFSVTMRPAPDDTGNVTHLVGGWRDIQSMVQARAALEIERARLRATLDSLLDPHVMLEAVRDSQGRIIDFLHTDANEAACEYNHLERARLVGRRLLELLPAHTSTGLLDLYRQALESGQPLVLNDFVYPHEILAEERRYDIRAIRVGDALSFTWRDVTDRYRMGQRLAASEEHYRLLASNSSDVVMRIDATDTIIWVSPSLKAALGWNPGDWIGQPIQSILVDAEGLKQFETDKAKLARGENIVSRPKVRAKDGTAHWIEVHAGPYRDPEGNLNGLVASFRVVDKEMDAEQLLERQATTDALTGLLNRRQFENLAHRELSRALREKEKTSLLMMDIDKFKTINDTLGHDAGDEVLRTLAHVCAPHLREVDIFARLGGEEFAVFMPDTPLEGAHHVAERLRQALGAEPVKLEGDKSVSFTVSIGVAEWSDHSEDLPGLVKRADQCLYHAKQSGRNQVCTEAPAKPATDRRG